MKKPFIVTVLFLMGIATLFSQEFNSKLHNPQPGLPDMDLVILPFGMDFPIKIGIVKANGTIEITMPDSDLSFLPKDQLEFAFGNLDYAFEFDCMSSEGFSSNPNAKAVKGGYIALWYKGRWAGTLFPMSDELLLPWIEDEYYMEPIKATFYEIIYVTEDTFVNTDCDNIWNLQSGDVKATYMFDLNLKKGYNLIAYQIEDIHKTNPNETSSKPSKVYITNTIDDYSKIKWVAKYF